jgi:hypothetical protein
VLRKARVLRIKAHAFADYRPRPEAPVGRFPSVMQ